MKIVDIEITLANQSEGTVAKVTTRRFFRNRVASYLCTRATPIMGAVWVSQETGLELDSYDLCSRINAAAQAAVNLKKVAALDAICQ